jgi:hypothetical protein
VVVDTRRPSCSGERRQFRSQFAHANRLPATSLGITFFATIDDEGLGGLYGRKATVNPFSALGTSPRLISIVHNRPPSNSSTRPISAPVAVR